jgi:hypothetical protein
LLAFAGFFSALLPEAAAAGDKPSGPAGGRVEAPPPALFPVQADGLWGYIDATGNVAVEVTCDAVGVRAPLRAGLIPVRKGDKWVYVDPAGRVKVTVEGKAATGRRRPVHKGRDSQDEPQVHAVGLFQEGLAPITVGTIRMGDIGSISQGFIDTRGRVVIQPKYGATKGFSEGLAAVQTGRKWGFVDAKGRMVIPADYDVVNSFAGGKALVRLGREWMLIDKSAKPLVRFGPYEQFRPFSHGLAAVSKNRKWGFVDEQGRLAVPLKFDIVEPFNDEATLVYLGGYDREQRKMVGHYRAIDRKGRLITERKFDSAYNFSEGLAPVQIDGKTVPLGPGAGAHGATARVHQPPGQGRLPLEARNAPRQATRGVTAKAAVRSAFA